MAKCPICNGPIYFLEGISTKDGSVCFQCAHIVPSLKTVTIAQIKEFWRENHIRWESFTETKVLHSPESLYISIDDTHKYFVFCRAGAMNREPVVYSYDEVESYEFITITGEVITKKKGGLTRAIVGGMVAGPAGAIVGSATAKAETIEKPDMKKIKVYLNTCAGRIQETSSNYPYPVGFTDFLDRCILGDKYGDDKETTASVSAADEILKFKALRDEGIISEAEFQAKKLQLLGL